MQADAGAHLGVDARVVHGEDQSHEVAIQALVVHLRPEIHGGRPDGDPWVRVIPADDLHPLAAGLVANFLGEVHSFDELIGAEQDHCSRLVEDSSEGEAAF